LHGQQWTKVQLAPGYQLRFLKDLSNEHLALMKRESATFERQLKAAEQTYGADPLYLVLTDGYVTLSDGDFGQ
jgi:hypothetical protein